MTKQKAFWSTCEDAVREWTAALEKNSSIKRLWRKDASLWKKSPKDQKDIVSRLGWLGAPELAKKSIGEMEAFKSEIKKEGFTHVLLLGMGGSSLAPELFQSVFGNTAGCPELLVLDSTDPARVADIEKKLDIEKTIFIVSSKSGGTIELLSFFKYFYEKVHEKKAEKAGSQFVAITDPGTPLVTLAKEKSFRKVFLAPEDVGGRFSALTYFGLLPACLIGVDIKKIISSALEMKGACAADQEVASHAAVPLGVGMAVLAEVGRDKLTLLTSAGLESFGDWAEQLVAESTGKEEMGVVPVVREALGKVESYGADRFFVALLLEGADNSALEAHLTLLEKAGHPSLRIFLKDVYDIGGEFFRWEMATAIACGLLKINAFDQPDVQAAKDKAKAILKELESGKAITVRQTEITAENFWEDTETGNYVSILAFLPDRPEIHGRLLKMAEVIRDRTKLAVTLGFGPRYLHSTGQLHKGGPNTGVFILITAAHAEDLKVPGEKYSFAELELAQAMGDFEALEFRARWMLHRRLADISEKALDGACVEIESAIGSGASVK